MLIKQTVQINLQNEKAIKHSQNTKSASGKLLNQEVAIEEDRVA